MTDRNSSEDNVPRFDLEAIKSWLENQNLEIQTKHQENEIRIREIEANKELALQSMLHQSEYLRNKPKEMRKNATRIAWIIGCFTILICLFILALLFQEKDDFANKFLGVASHVATLGMGYYFGRRVTKSKHPDAPNGEIIDN